MVLTFSCIFWSTKEIGYLLGGELNTNDLSYSDWLAKTIALLLISQQYEREN